MSVLYRFTFDKVGNVFSKIQICLMRFICILNPLIDFMAVLEKNISLLDCR